MVKQNWSLCPERNIINMKKNVNVKCVKCFGNGRGGGGQGGYQSSGLTLAVA